MKIQTVREQLRSSLWAVPTGMVLVAVVLAVGLIQFDRQAGSPITAFTFGGGADGARSMLEAVATTVITVAGVTFSLTVVTLQLASSQFSPRLLRTFLRDTGNQIVLGVFLATFAYCLVVLRVVRADTEETRGFVPDLAVTVGLLAALSSLAALVYFIDHIARKIRVDSMMRDVEHDGLDVLGDEHPEAQRPTDEPVALPEVPADARTIPALRSGFLDAIDGDQLAKVATEHGITLLLAARLGEHVVRDTALAFAWGLDAVDASGSATDDRALAEAVDGAVEIAYERTIEQDVSFSIRQLVDIAAKALSPGVNDPTTAVHATGHLGALLCALAGRRLEADLRRDAAGRLLVAVPCTRFAEHLETACGQIRRYGADEPAVSRALLRMLGQVASVAVTEEQRRLVAQQARLVLDAAERAIAEPHDLAQIRAAIPSELSSTLGSP